MHIIKELSFSFRPKVRFLNVFQDCSEHKGITKIIRAFWVNRYGWGKG